MRALWARYRKYLGPAFVAFEAVMHVYLLFYLTFVEWTNIAVWGFTAFELSMFIYLFFNKDGRDDKHSHTPKGHLNCRKLCDTCPYYFGQSRCSCD